jgi:hypothetical protein
MRELTRSELRKLARVAEIAGDDPMLFDGRGERLVRACLSLNDRVVGKLQAERDALRAELATERALFKEFQVKGIPMKYKRMEFNARLQKEISDLEAERDALREAIIEWADAWEGAGDPQATGSACRLIRAESVLTALAAKGKGK